MKHNPSPPLKNQTLRSPNALTTLRKNDKPLKDHFSSPEFYRRVLSKLWFVRTFDGLDARDFLHQFYIKLCQKEMNGGPVKVSNEEEAIGFTLISVKRRWFDYMRVHHHHREIDDAGPQSANQERLATTVWAGQAACAKTEEQIVRTLGACRNLGSFRLTARTRRLFAHLDEKDALIQALAKIVPQRELISDLGWPQCRVSRSLSEMRRAVAAAVQQSDW